MDTVLNILIIQATILSWIAIIAMIILIITMIRLNKTLNEVKTITHNINELVNNPVTVFSSMISKYL